MNGRIGIFGRMLAEADEFESNEEDTTFCEMISLYIYLSLLENATMVYSFQSPDVEVESLCK